MRLFAGILFFVSQMALAGPMLINGAGATFPHPIYSKWFSEYRNVDESVMINYQSVGSGGGIRQLLRGTVDFGASDAPMKAKEEKRAKEKVVHVPTVLGAVTISYNLDIKKPLRLSGPVLADIFLGNITKWNDTKLAELNPGVELPDQAIIVAHRSDGSGTTAVFSDYMAKVSPKWKKNVGVGKALKWPTGLGAKGNAGVTGLIKGTPGTIGYIELTYALSNNLPVAAIKNASGEFVMPSPKSVSIASEGAVSEMKAKDFKVSITDSPAKGAYPISTFTWLLVYEKMDREKGEKILSFLNWAIDSQAQTMASELNYAPLPKKVASMVKERIRKIKLQ